VVKHLIRHYTSRGNNEECYKKEEVVVDRYTTIVIHQDDSDDAMLLHTIVAELFNRLDDDDPNENKEPIDDCSTKLV